MKKNKIDPIILLPKENWDLNYFRQMAGHIQRLYEQAFIDFHLHNLSGGSDLMDECRKAAQQLKKDFAKYAKFVYWIGEEVIRTYDPKLILTI